MFVTNPALAVIMHISAPDVSASGMNGHTHSGPVSYIVSYEQENIPPDLTLYDDPRFFELRRFDDDSVVSSIIFIRAVDAISREIRIEQIQDEGDFYLYVYAGTAEDGDGFASEGFGDPFTVDKTAPEAILTGPFEADLTTPVTLIEEGDDVYYVLDFSVDHLPDAVLQSRFEADLFPIEPVGDGNWRTMNSDYFSLTDTSFSGTAMASRTGAMITIRIQNISGPEQDFGIYIYDGAASDFALNPSLAYQSNLVPFDDDIGPEISIGFPNPSLTHGGDVEFDINYTNSDLILLDESYIVVETMGDVTADLTVIVNQPSFALVRFSNFSGEGQIRFSIAAGSAQDASGDLADAAGPSEWVTVDIYGPQVVFGEPSPLHTVSGPAIFPVTFVSANNVSLTPGDVIVNTTGSVQYTGVDVIFTGVDSREVHVTGLSGEGTVSINIPAGVAVDFYWQESEASEESPAVQVGPLPPMSISISAPNPGWTLAGPVSYTVTYKGVASISLNAGHLSTQASGTAYVDDSDISISGSGLSRTVTLSNISGEGTLALVVAPGSAQDAEANLIAGIAGNAFAVGNDDDDGDMVPNGQEDVDGTDRNDPASYLDSDGDLVPDFVEQFIDGTDKFDAFSFKDTDGGGTPDYVELVRLPLTVAFVFDELDESDDQHDSDGDGIPDYLELKLRVAGRDYHENNSDLPVIDGDMDSDSDGIEDGLEFYLSELLGIDDPGFYDDFDRDGYFDHHEVRFGLDPELAALRFDADFDGIADRVEAAAEINIFPSTDTDDDGIPDFIEYVFNRARVNVFDSASVYVSNLIAGNPLVDAFTDTDDDGMPDLEELAEGFDPLSNDAPVLWLGLRQGQPKASVCLVSQSSGEVEVRVMIGNMQTHISTVDWSASNADILGIANLSFDRLSFDPATLTTGLYEIVVRVERTQGAQTLESTFTQHIRIAAGGIRADLDENGICDDRQATVGSVAQRHLAPLNSAGEILRSQKGQFFHLGYLSSFVNNTNNLQVPYAVIESRGKDLAPAVDDIVDSEFGNVIPRVHFELRNLPAVGGSAQFILPLGALTNGLPASAQYRLLVNSGWQDFDTTEDVLESAPQNCNSSPVFELGLKQGYRCIRMTIRDGGANDLDGALNGLIVHLGAPALQGAAHVDDPDVEEDDDPYADFVPGKRTIVVGKAGSLNVLGAVLLWMMLMFRFSARLFPKFIFFSGLLFSLSLHADDVNDKSWFARTWEKLPLPELSDFYVGVGVGQSGLDGDFSNLYDVKDDSDVGFKLWLDYQFRERWFVEFEYANLGESSVQGSAAAIATNVFPAQFSETIAYQHTSVTALYDYPLPYEKFSVFAKAGIAYADIQSDLNLEVVDRFSPSIGLGTQYRFNKKYSARLEYETFSKDSNLLSLAIAMRLAEPKQEAEPEPLIPVTPVLPPEEEQLAQAEAEEERVPQTLEEFIQALEPEEPSMSMEELYADLKASIEPSSLFELNSAVLSRRLMANLDELIHFLDTYPSVRVVITGHASDEGGEYLNENLSRLRAHGAKTYLQANGIADERVIVRARGAHFPKYTEADDDYRIRNRRIEYDFYIPKKK